MKKLLVVRKNTTKNNKEIIYSHLTLISLTLYNDCSASHGLRRNFQTIRPIHKFLFAKLDLPEGD